MTMATRREFVAASGKLADFVILGRDPHTEEPGKIKDIPVLRTVLGGRTTHSA